MDHKYFQSRLSAFVDGELPADEQALVGEHLEQCEDCQRRYEKLWLLGDLTDRASELADTDYWEASAQRIEEKLGASDVPVTDLSEARTKSRSSFWWKLPAIAASIVVVGYIGLHESDILKDDLMIPPSESATPILPDNMSDTDQIEETLAIPTQDKSVAVPVDSERHVVNALESQPAIIKDVEFESDVSKVRLSHDEPIAGSIDEVSRNLAEPVKPELSEFVEEAVASPTPAKSKTRAKVSASAIRDADVVDRYVTRADKKSADYRDSQEPVVTKPVLVPSPVATDSAGWADDASFADVETQAALDQAFELDVWRHQRDSLVALIAELDTTDTARQNKQPRAVQGFSKSAPENIGRATEAVVARTSLSQARTDLVEVWCRICQASENEAEVVEGIGFLKGVASNKGSVCRKKAAACLELIDRQ